MRDDGIGSRCEYKIGSEIRTGMLLAWSTDYEEVRDGVGQYPVALVMNYETHKVDIVWAQLITFVNP